jgi:hypothetical protein
MRIEGESRAIPRFKTEERVEIAPQSRVSHSRVLKNRTAEEVFKQLSLSNFRLIFLNKSLQLLLPAIVQSNEMISKYPRIPTPRCSCHILPHNHVNPNASLLNKYCLANSKYSAMTLRNTGYAVVVWVSLLVTVRGRTQFLDLCFPEHPMEPASHLQKHEAIIKISKHCERVS